MIRVLVVGLGAVGSVVAAALARGGAEVSVLVRPRQATSVASGTRIVHLSGVRARPSVFRETFVPACTYTDPLALPPRFDQTWLCLPTSAVNAPSVTEAVRRAQAPTVVGIAPRLEPGKDETAIGFVQAIVGFLAFAREGDDGEEIVVYDPPWSPSRFGGEPSRAAAVVEALRRGGRPARTVVDAHATLAFSSATLMPVIAAIEASGWHFRALGEHGHDRVAARAVAEACAVTEATLGVERPLLAHLVNGVGLRLALAAAPLAVPFDVERFVERHFVKVRAQTRALFVEWLTAAAARGIGVPSLEALAKAIGARPNAASRAHASEDR